MSKFIDLSKAGECLRKIVDNNRCGFCDKLSDVFLRCVYGHIACEECSAKEEGCFTCFTTFNSPVNNSWVVDQLQAEKTKNALHLLNTFQDTFKIDVYNRQRISDQLKAEKELFPDCIQAPAKYSNKKKNTNTSFSNYNKENCSQQSFYPGEDIYPLQKPRMEKSKYIQQWLVGAENDLPRKPFAGINVNNYQVKSTHSKSLRNKTTFRSSIIKNNLCDKTRHSKKKTTNIKSNGSRTLNRSSSESFAKTRCNTSIMIENQHNIKDNMQQRKSSNMQDDSGIVMDDEYIVIEDTPTEAIDKDELALQAVHEAEKQEDLDYSSLHDATDAYNKGEIKVPYTKKGYLYASCPSCTEDGDNQADIKDQRVGNISITIEYGNKVETTFNKHSILVQTDISDINKSDNTVTSSIKNNVENDNIAAGKINSCNDKEEISQDLFTNDVTISQHLSGKNIGPMASGTASHNKKDVVIIEESDTDAEPEHLQVTAEVHRASLPRDYDVLSELPLFDMRNRKRRAKRGATPGSTDSSEKENFDPNRSKRLKCMKKGKKKSNKS